MCGIAGALVFEGNSFAVTEAYIVKMRDTMAHRGPDGAGSWTSPDGRVGLGHRRLSIIDLSDDAAQPMCNEDGTIWIVFNGEIYNHATIRRELNEIGRHTWRTDHSDTEVILHAYEQWGKDCLTRFRGMFAFAVWDQRTRNLWLVRDRIGIKPLYYSVHSGRITFASEIKALLTDRQQKREVNEAAFFHYLTFLTSPAPDTLFAGIQKLPAGTWLRVSADGAMEQRRYWDVWDHTTPVQAGSDAGIAEMVLAELRTAVKLRKVSDVPVGCFLSGGIDSSANVALFSEDEPVPVRTFTISYDGSYRSYVDEVPYARQMAQQVGAAHHVLSLNVDDLIAFLPEMVRFQDEPLADPVCVPLYFVSKLARDNGVTVCQVGEGADELFIGYPAWMTALQLQRLNDWPVPALAKRAGLAGLRLFGKEETRYYEWLRRGASGTPVFWGGTDAFVDNLKRGVLSERLRRRFAQSSSWEVLDPHWRRFQEAAWEKSPANWMSYVDLKLRLPELMLMRVDKMTMAVSLEGRVPFLDHKFVELAMSIPAGAKIRTGPKSLLKQAVRGLIPDELIDRKKQGFNVPVYEWFFDRLGAMARTELESFCRQTDFLDWRGVSAMLDQGRGTYVWFLLNFALWWKEFIGGQGHGN